MHMATKMVYYQSNGSNSIIRIKPITYYRISIVCFGGYYIYDMAGAKDFDGIGIEGMEYCVEIEFGVIGMEYNCQQTKKIIGERKTQKIIEKYWTWTKQEHMQNIGNIFYTPNNNDANNDAIKIESNAVGIGFKYSQTDYECIFFFGKQQ
eukprot:395078_1